MDPIKNQWKYFNSSIGDQGTLLAYWGPGNQYWEPGKYP